MSYFHEICGCRREFRNMHDLYLHIEADHINFNYDSPVAPESDNDNECGWTIFGIPPGQSISTEEQIAIASALEPPSASSEFFIGCNCSVESMFWDYKATAPFSEEISPHAANFLANEPIEGELPKLPLPEEFEDIGLKSGLGWVDEPDLSTVLQQILPSTPVAAATHMSGSVAAESAIEDPAVLQPHNTITTMTTITVTAPMGPATHEVDAIPGPVAAPSLAQMIVMEGSIPPLASQEPDIPQMATNITAPSAIPTPQISTSPAPISIPAQSTEQNVGPIAGPSIDPSDATAGLPSNPLQEAVTPKQTVVPTESSRSDVPRMLTETITTPGSVQP